MRKKALKKKEQKEKYKVLVVIGFFLFSGILYSHSFYGGTLDMGNEITADEIGVVDENVTLAEEFLSEIDINTASVTDLDRLSCIGESRAMDIIKYREENGNFSRIEDIMNVPGIGEKIFEEIKGQITVGE
ncbi:MAG: helix-hairpin-helix domain-containing protein [Anaerotignum sp.]|nr:helix-hairpin-helix domain-containing protein [Anaerotignum sp.]MBR5122309.1 helix-hairpin-helix domain-containing protein [Anaerotignum sp.]MBR5590310.1 helix-hairpin-helix domain-containing protein [Anaerotignum sp.]